MKEKQTQPERRHFNELRKSDIFEGDDSVRVEGYAAVFNKRSEMLWDWGESFYERIAPGAFDGVMDNDVRALLNHDANYLLGRTKSGTLKLKQDDNGLHFVLNMPKSRPELIESIERGDMDKNSFAFFVEDDEWSNEDGVAVRTIKKIKELRDISLVTYPAYPDTSLKLAERSYKEWKDSQTKEEESIEYKREYQERERALKLHAHII